MSRNSGGVELFGRVAEREALDALVDDVLAGRSRVVVMRGEAGVGKSALLRHLTDRLSGWHIATAVGVESEMELAYSGLHQLCAPMLDRIDRVPAPQQAALATVFGRGNGGAPDRFLVSLATLSLWAEIAEQQPLLCVVDDAQWLDQASTQTVAFVARRLLAEPIAIVCAARTGTGDAALSGLPQLDLRGLDASESRALLIDNVRAPLDPAICEQVIAESRGNPLALLEFARARSLADLAGGYALPSQSVPSKIERSYVQRLRALPAETQLLVLVAASEPLGDPFLMARAAERLGIEMAAVDPALDLGLLRLGARVEFAHPLVRSAAYRSAASADVHRVHRALADATNAEIDPDRRAWHRARGTPGTNEEAAAQLERSAGRARSRGGAAAAAAFLGRAVELTPDPVLRADRAIAAVEASLEAGAFDDALGLLDAAASGPPNGLRLARVELLRGEMALFSAPGRDAPPLLLKAAASLERLDVSLARDTYLDAWGAALYAGRLATRGLAEVSRAARSAPRPEGPPRPSDLLLDGLATLITDGRAAAGPLLEEATRTFADGQLLADPSFRWGWLTVVPTYALWDEESAYRMCASRLRALRETGALAQLPLDLQTFGLLAARCGDFAGAHGVVAEIDAISELTGSAHSRSTAMSIAAVFRGHEAEARELIESVRDEARTLGQGVVLQLAGWMLAVLCNGLGRHEEALAAARESSNDSQEELFVSAWATMELLEAAIKTADLETASLALERILGATVAARSESALGIAARSRALMSRGVDADDLYREAIQRLGSSRLRPEFARTQLLYGEWLHGEHRGAEARQHLHAAHDLFSEMGMAAFAERARRELLASGERVRKRVDERVDRLTPQEQEIARLAGAGRTNPEIGAVLFLSPRTVEWHLGKVFTKLGISSRRELAGALPSSRRGDARAQSEKLPVGAPGE
jgi:DNA-binding CsgD family transcriptional regulator